MSAMPATGTTAQGNGVGLLDLATPAIDAAKAAGAALLRSLDAGRESTAVRLAIGSGVRDENMLTDLVFRARHPERGGRPLGAGEYALVREWIEIRNDLVRPLLSGAVPLPAHVPIGPASGFVPRPAEIPGGGRITDKREPSAADLVTVTGVNGPVPLHRLAAEAWTELVRAARGDGIPAPILLPTSGYRSVARQAALWADALGKYGSPEAARKWVAPPGGSPHHSGRAIDFYLGGRNSSANVDNLRTLPAYKWLVLHAEGCGFYPYSQEPWHWEYNPPAARPELEEEAWRKKEERAKTPEPVRKDYVAARLAFRKLRDAYARALGVAKAGHVHHAIELQVLKGFPGVFTAKDLNGQSNMRRMNHGGFHNSWLRLFWNKRYRALDDLLKQPGAPKPGTDEYKAFVRRKLEGWRRVADGAIRRHERGRALPPILTS